MHAFNLYWYARPYAATALVASYDDEAGPQLYGVDPAGACLVREWEEGGREGEKEGEGGKSGGGRPHGAL